LSVNAVALVLIVVWGAIAIAVVVVVATQFATWGREDDDGTRGPKHTGRH
jgi:hypothetical protein